jgi:hypothetical protein
MYKFHKRREPFFPIIQKESKKENAWSFFLVRQTCPSCFCFLFFVGTFAQFCTIKSYCMYIILIGV